MQPHIVTDFWLHDITPQQWDTQDDALDAQITEKFSSYWQAAHAGQLKSWTSHPDHILAYIILCDQFPRNMFRGRDLAFATDAKARMAAKTAIMKNWDLRVETELHRQFFYLPLMHSENQCDQNRCVRLMVERMPTHLDQHLNHARAHREIIRKFGRFPYRNAALGRGDTAVEAAFLQTNGYQETLNSLAT